MEFPKIAAGNSRKYLESARRPVSLRDREAAKR
jgi:hypothetical protein